MRDVLRFATINGAKHLRLDGKTGSLTPGKEADIIILDATAPNVAPLNNVPGAVVSLMDTSNVETVIVAGKVRKWKGQLLDVDMRHLRRQLERFARLPLRQRRGSRKTCSAGRLKRLAGKVLRGGFGRPVRFRARLRRALIRRRVYRAALDVARIDRRAELSFRRASRASRARAGSRSPRPCRPA